MIESKEIEEFRVKLITGLGVILSVAFLVGLIFGGFVLKVICGVLLAFMVLICVIAILDDDDIAEDAIGIYRKIFPKKGEE